MLWPAKTLTYASVNAMLEYLKWHVTTRIVILDYFTLILVKTSLHVTTWRSIWCFRRAVWASRYTVEHALSGNRLISNWQIFRICSRALEDPSASRCKNKIDEKKKAILDERRWNWEFQGSNSSREALKFEKIDDAKPSRGLSRPLRPRSKTEGKRRVHFWNLHFAE